MWQVAKMLRIIIHPGIMRVKVAIEGCGHGHLFGFRAEHCGNATVREHVGHGVHRHLRMTVMMGHEARLEERLLHVRTVTFASCVDSKRSRSPARWRADDVGMVQ